MNAGDEPGVVGALRKSSILKRYLLDTEKTMPELTQHTKTVAQRGKERARRLHQHPAGLPLLLFIVLLVLSGAAFWFANRQGVVAEYVSRDTFIAIVSHDGKKSTVPTDAKTVGELLKKLDVSLASGRPRRACCPRAHYAR
jgi:hypothetical protein